MADSIEKTQTAASSPPLSSGESAPAGKSRAKGCIIKLILAAVLLGVVLIAWYLFTKSESDAQFNRFLTEASDAGVVLSIDQVIEQDFSPTNADMDLSQDWADIARFFNSENVVAQLKGFPSFGMSSNYVWPPQKWRQLKAAQDLMESYKKELITLQFASTGVAFWNVDYLLDQSISTEALQGLWRAFDFLVLSCYVAAHENDQEELVLRIQSCLSFSNCLAKHPAYLADRLDMDRRAELLLMNALRNVKFDEESLLKFRDALLDIDYWPMLISDWDFQRAARLLMYTDTERFRTTRIYQEIKGFPEMQGFLGNLDATIEYSPYAGDDAVRFLELMAERRAQMNGGYFAAADTLSDLQADLEQPLEGLDRYRYPTAAFMVPEISESIRRAGEAMAYRDVALGMLAVDYFRLRESAFPKTLDEAIAGFLPVPPFDPFADQPVHFWSDDASAWVTSWGPNRTDDRGNRDDIGLPIPLKKWDPNAIPVDKID